MDSLLLLHQKMMNRGFMRITITSILPIFIFLLIFSCGVKKYIPEDKTLYTGASLEMEADIPKSDRKELRSRLESQIRPEPNSKILGMRLGLWAYYKGTQEKPGFINRFLYNKLGEEPVYMDQVSTEKTENILINRLENRGYFYTIAESEVRERDKFASVSYKLSFGKPYVLETYEILFDSSLVYQEIAKLIPESPLEKGMRFDLDYLKAERERIDGQLKSKGFYNFNPDLLIFEADTNQYEDRRFDLFLRLKTNTPRKSKFPYRVRNIRIYPDYNLSDTIRNADTTIVQGKEIIQEDLVFKPYLLEPYVLIDEGSLYSPEISKQTSNRLSSIGNFRYVNINYMEKDTIPDEDGTLTLDADIYLSPLTKRALRAELQAVTKSNNFAGPSLLINYRNRNLFYGGEILSLTANFGYEQQLSAGDRDGLRSIELGLTADLIFPRVIFPASANSRFKYAIPKTKVSLGTEYQNRTNLYKINSYKASYGYFWNANRYQYHEFNPISLSIFNLYGTTPEFENILDANPFLRRSFEQQFIFGMNYTFNFNQLVDTYRRHAIFVGTTVDLAGNSLRGINKLGDSNNPDRVFGLQYAQYTKADIDFRYYWRLTQNQSLITRVFGGYGLPLGSSESLPFVKQYFSGGPRSVRAFRIRSLGPGTYIPEGGFTNASFFDQAGDIRIEGNIEYRFPIVPYLKGAVFADAGNVWLVNENEALPGGKFTSDWAKELGVGAGIGLRIDIQIFVIRFDLATPLRKPWLPENNRWVKEFSPDIRAWRRDNLILNFAIGYPF
jgi:outer membrane protein insertion porin family